jgi:SAM-dependent methyltransferase
LPTDVGAHASGRGTIFDGVAEEYDSLRPGYPRELVAHVLGSAALPEDAAILEVGCGSGQASRLFAGRARRMVCVEAGLRMAALAAENLAQFPHVSIENARFEEWPLQPGAFHLVIAAQSFHWVDPQVGYERAARCLRPGGALALFWNRPVGAEPALRQALDAVYERHAPGLSRTNVPREMPWVHEAIDRSDRFEPVEIRRFPWTDKRDAESYARLLATYSDHAALPETQRRPLLEEIRDTIERFGGEIAVEHYTLLFFARRKP